MPSTSCRVDPVGMSEPWIVLPSPMVWFTAILNGCTWQLVRDLSPKAEFRNLNYAILEMDAIQGSLHGICLFFAIAEQDFKHVQLLYHALQQCGFALTRSDTTHR